MAETPSSPPAAEDALSWYKSQYEMLESELAEFRESSRELEQELEKDIERAEKQERVLQEKAEALSFEVEEWKRKYKESKVEASSAQNALEKEITTLRDSNRSLQLKLRDTEVANDDFERQARNTTSSLEDMESKFNQAIERAVMMEEEIKTGEQEREQLRIESQRLREELADLKIEADLMQDKIKKHEARHLSAISTDLSIMSSPTFDKNVNGSPNSTASSPLVTTPPESKPTIALPDARNPPSPPMSDASAPVPNPGSAAKTPAKVMEASARKSRLPSLDGNATPRAPRTALGTAIRQPGGRVSGVGLRTPANGGSRQRLTGHRLPASNSLTHIRSLTAQMQRLEARVHSARSKLPGPTITPPRASPRSVSRGPPSVPSTVTIRSRKRTIGSSASSVAGDDSTPTHTTTNPRVMKSHVPRLSASGGGVGRLSFGPLPNRGPEQDMSRPSSRASASSYARPSSRSDMVPPPRPMSRASTSGARTPMGRPQSSMSGSTHSHSASFGRVDEKDGHGGQGANGRQTPNRRRTYSKIDPEAEGTGIPTPGGGLPIRSSARQSEGRRTSSGVPVTSFRRPSSSASRKLSDLGETY